MSRIAISISVHFPPSTFRMEPPLAWSNTLDVCMNAASAIKIVLVCYVGWTITVAVSWSIRIRGRIGL
jgi:hypothetical protein